MTDRADRITRSTVAPPKPRGASTRPRSLVDRRRLGGADGNEILTSTVAAVLVLLLAAEGVTVVQVRGLRSAHMFIGLADGWCARPLPRRFSASPAWATTSNPASVSSRAVPSRNKTSSSPITTRNDPDIRATLPTSRHPRLLASEQTPKRRVETHRRDRCRPAVAIRRLTPA